MNRELQMTDHPGLARTQPALPKVHIFTYGKHNL
jgi:hypothetical protein